MTAGMMNAAVTAAAATAVAAGAAAVTATVVAAMTAAVAVMAEITVAVMAETVRTAAAMVAAVAASLVVWRLNSQSIMLTLGETVLIICHKFTEHFVFLIIKRSTTGHQKVLILGNIMIYCKQIKYTPNALESEKNNS